MKTLTHYLQDCLRQGRYFFSRTEAQSILHLSEAGFKNQLKRLYAKKSLKHLGHSLYMIIPFEYQNLGSLPLEWIVSTLMKHLNRPYYVGLLSAAAHFGSAHQQPMIFQVICSEPLKPISLPKGQIHFYQYAYLQQAKTEAYKTGIGSTIISTKEQTIFDLMRFNKKAGYFDNVATIIRDLSEEVDTQKLFEIANLEPEETVLQRLGYLFDLKGSERQAEAIFSALQNRKFYWAKLKPDLKTPITEKNRRWRLNINDTIEFEE